MKIKCPLCGYENYFTGLEDEGTIFCCNCNNNKPLVKPKIPEATEKPNKASLGLHKEAMGFGSVLTTYSLRDIGPAGGYIFYDKETYSDGWRYLEAAPALWNGGTEDPTSVWSNIIDILVGTGTAIGTGQANTARIVAQSGCTSGAAWVCAEYEVTVNSVIYNDWFLPSEDDLNLMYTNLKVFGVGGFTEYYYWSSSEVDATYAWGQHFGIGFQSHGNKGYDYPSRVRAVRAF